MNWLQIILITSAIVVFIVGIGIYIYIYTKVKKIRAKYNDQHATQLSKIIRPNSGEFDSKILQYFNSKVSVFDLELILNSIYQNGYRKIRVVGNDTKFITTSIWKQLANIRIFDENFTDEQITELKQKFSDYQDLQLIINEQYDAVIVNESQYDYNKTYDVYNKLVRKQGMLIIIDNFKQNDDIKELTKHLNYLKQWHNTVKAKHNILLIEKNI